MSGVANITHCNYFQLMSMKSISCASTKTLVPFVKHTDLTETMRLQIYSTDKSQFITVPNEVAKVMFLQVSVILSMGGSVLSQYALQQVSGGCPGPHPRGKFRGICPGGWMSRPTSKGEV